MAETKNQYTQISTAFPEQVNQTKDQMSLDELPDICTLEEFSKVFRVSRATAYRMAARGNIPCLRIGRRVIMCKEHLMRWIDMSVPLEKDMGGEKHSKAGAAKAPV